MCSLEHTNAHEAPRQTCSPFFPFECFLDPNPIPRPIPCSDKSPFLPEGVVWDGDNDDDDEEERIPDGELANVFKL